MRGFTPHPDREPLYMGLRPIPHLGIFFGKKLPKNPKKPNCIGFKPSNTDSEQGCRRQPCFFARRRQHGTATAPTPRAPAVPPAPAARRAAPHSPVVHPTLTVVPSVIAPSLRLLARRSPCPALTARTPAAPSEPTVHAAHSPVVLTAPARLPAGFLKLRAFSFFAKQFKL